MFTRYVYGRFYWHIPMSEKRGKRWWCKTLMVRFIPTARRVAFPRSHVSMSPTRRFVELPFRRLSSIVRMRGTIVGEDLRFWNRVLRLGTDLVGAKNTRSSEPSVHKVLSTGTSPLQGLWRRRAE